MFVIKFNNDKYWCQNKTFSTKLYKAQIYKSKTVASNKAKHIIDRLTTWYKNTELKSYEILEVEIKLKNPGGKQNGKN